MLAAKWEKYKGLAFVYRPVDKLMETFEKYLSANVCFNGEHYSICMIGMSDVWKVWAEEAASVCLLHATIRKHLTMASAALQNAITHGCINV